MPFSSFAQGENETVAKFYSEQKELGKPIWNYVFEDFPGFYSQLPDAFEKKVDSLRAIYKEHLESFSGSLSDSLYQQEKAAIKLAFDKLLLEYEIHHPIYADDTSTLSESTLNYLIDNKNFFNDPFYLENKDVQAYLSALVDLEASRLVETEVNTSDNKYLNARWRIIREVYKDPEKRENIQFNTLIKHIENLGVKNLQPYISEFIDTAQSKELVDRIVEVYDQELNNYQDHTRLSYKTVDGLDLDLHVFPPENNQRNAPVIVYFHGGSWSEGKPDWFFESARSYASKGWFAVAVEYRIKERHNTLPFEAVKDAKSAIRFLRENAEELNIDQDKIVVTGNSAGGHLALSTALIDTLNDVTDDLNISASPNAIMVNAAVYDLTVDNSKWIVKDFENKEIVKSISPNHNRKKIEAPILMIHGENDQNCAYSTAEYFYQEMKKIGNNIELVSIPKAGHFIWFGRFAGSVYPRQEEFLHKLYFTE